MNAHPALRHHFDDLEQQREAATLGMWVFLLTEVLFFGGMFGGYAIYRWSYPQAFAEGSHHLDLVLGTVNTAVLLVSSFTMVMAVHSAEHRRNVAVTTYLGVTALLGLTFLAIKAVEYTHKFHEHLVPGPHFSAEVQAPQVQLFFSFYFALTGMHALHMTIGIVMMTIFAVRAARGRFADGYTTPVEIAGLYWHFVDVVWIFLFPLLYLIGRHA